MNRKVRKNTLSYFRYLLEITTGTHIGILGLTATLTCECQQPTTFYRIIELGNGNGIHSQLRISPRLGLEISFSVLFFISIFFEELRFS